MTHLIARNIQCTVHEPVSWQGVGVHTGEECSVIITPAEPDTGLRWKKSGQERTLPFDIKLVTNSNRSTDLASGDQKVQTVEHILAALHGAGITNCIIECTGPEIPILDGSAQPFYESLKKQVLSQSIDRKKIWSPDRTLEFRDEESGAEYILIPQDHLSIDVILSYDKVDVGGVHAHYDEQVGFDDLADARTFVLSEELQSLVNDQRIKGGDLANALIIGSNDNAQQDLANALKALNHPNQEEILATYAKGSAFRYHNEPARHKLLDLIGDLALLGYHLKAKIIAKKPGHTGNTALVRYLKPLLRKSIKLGYRPSYDPSEAPIFDTADIQRHLPHRYPFLLVDKIIEMTPERVVGIKNITMNEALFQGHFPNNPVFPGVLQMEALAQTGGILALHGKENPSDWDAYFLKMDEVKFKKKVLPGDTLMLKMELISPIRRGLVHMKGTAYVGDDIASEGILIAQIVNRTTLK